MVATPSVRRVDVYYGSRRVLNSVDLAVNEGEIVCLLGRNASGKTTTMKTILSIVRPTRGAVYFDGNRIDRWDTKRIVRAGISVMRKLAAFFPYMTVMRTLNWAHMPMMVRCGIQFERVYSLFPLRLSEAQGSAPAAPCRAGSSRCWRPSPDE